MDLSERAERAAQQHHALHVAEEQLVGNSVEAAKNYDLISVVMICLGDAQERQADVLRMLDVLLSSECKAEEKKQILEEEFAIQMSERVEEEVAQMCNLSQGIVERGIAQGMERGIAQGIERGMAQGMEKGAFSATLASLRAIDRQRGHVCGAGDERAGNPRRRAAALSGGHELSARRWILAQNWGKQPTGVVRERQTFFAQPHNFGIFFPGPIRKRRRSFRAFSRDLPVR